MIETPDIERPSKELVAGLAKIGSATASGELSRLGIRDPHIRGLSPWTRGKAVAGPALTLQFMPKREDIYRVDEYADPRSSCTAMCSTTLSRATLWSSMRVATWAAASLAR